MAWTSDCSNSFFNWKNPNQLEYFMRESTRDFAGLKIYHSNWIWQKNAVMRTRQYFLTPPPPLPLVIIMRRPLMRLQITPLAERCSTKLALIRSLPCVRPFVIPYLCLPREGLPTQPANKRLIPCVHNRVHLQVVWRSKLLSTQMARILFYSRVGALVLGEVLLAEERLAALLALIRPWSNLVRFLVCFEGVLGGEVLATQLANVGSDASVCVDVLVQEVARAVDKIFIWLPEQPLLLLHLIYIHIFKHLHLQMHIPSKAKPYLYLFPQISHVQALFCG